MKRQWISKEVENVYAQGSGELVTTVYEHRPETNYEFIKRAVKEGIQGLGKILLGSS